jgi:hypothetical protein
MKTRFMPKDIEPKPVQLPITYDAGDRYLLRYHRPSHQ